jgi:hypothetical protein
MAKTATVLFAALLGAGVAHASTSPSELPAPQTRDGITWLSGGVGESQAHAFRKQAARYPLSLEFLIKPEAKNLPAEFTAEVPVTVRNAQGKVILSATAQGPFMLIKLPEGRYQVFAEHDGRKIERAVVVGRTHRSVMFEWPAQRA